MKKRTGQNGGKKENKSIVDSEDELTNDHV